MRAAACGHEYIATDQVCRICGQSMRLGSIETITVKGITFRKLAIGVASLSAFLGLVLAAGLVMLGNGGRKALNDPNAQSDLRIAQQNAQKVTNDQSSRLIPGAPEAQAMFPPDEPEEAGKAPAEVAAKEAGQDSLMNEGDDAEDSDSGGNSRVHIVVHRSAAAPEAVGGEAVPIDPPVVSPDTAASKKPVAAQPVDASVPAPAPAGAHANRPAQ